MPTLTGFASSTTFNENVVFSTPQVLDADVVFTDAEGDFDGGTLTVSGLLAEDTVSVLNQGSGGGQIGLSGSNVTYGGVVIGTLSGGVGATLTITFNASATSAAIDALIQNLTYRNTSQAPTESRDLALNVTDALGNDLAGPPTISVTVTAVNDAPTVTGGTSVTLAAVAEDTADPAGATVADLFGSRFSDVDGDAFAGIMIGINNANASQGVWQVFSGGVWFNLPALGPTNTYLVSASDSLRFLPAADFNGAVPSIVLLLIDDSDGAVVTGTRLDSSLTGSGGTTRYSSSTVTLSSSITAAPESPAVTGLPTDVTVTQDVASDLDLSAATLSDADTAGDITVVLTASAGTMTAASGGGVTVTNSGTGAITLTGTASAIDTFLNTASAIQYTGALNAVGDDAATVTISADDGGGAVQLGVVNIDIAAVTGPTPGPDTLSGTAGDDLLEGLGGDDVLDGGDGNDNVKGGQGDDDLTGGDGDDTLNGGAGVDVMSGGTGDDYYYVDDAGDLVDETGGDGTDTVGSFIDYRLPGGVENLTLLSRFGTAFDGTGNGLANTITGNGEDNILAGLAGADTLYGAQGDDCLVGGDGDDILDGGTGHDCLDGGNGADTLIGGVGSDMLLGWAGHDILLGGEGNDILDGAAGNDSLDGGAHDDILFGGTGHDYLDGGTGADVMIGEAGGDTYIVDNIGDTVVELAGDGTDTVEASITYTLADDVENLVLTGGAAIDGAGNDVNNVITGNGAANTLTGGGGFDTLTGGLGGDTFLFSQDDIGAGLVVDRVLDLNFAQGDVIDLSAIDADSVTAGDQAFSIVGKLTGTAGQATLTYAAGSNLTTLNVDLDGDGVADYRIILTGDHRTTSNLYTGGGDVDGGWVL